MEELPQPGVILAMGELPDVWMQILRRVACVGSLLAIAALALTLGSQAADGAAAPTAYTGQAAEVTASSVTLKGSVNPGDQATTYYFQYGLTTAYAAQTPLASAGVGSATIHVAAVLGGLSAGSTYHFRLVTVNPSGTVDGLDGVFTMKRIPLTFTLAATPGREVFASSFSIDGTLSGTGSAGRMVVLQADQFPYLSGFRDIAGPTAADAGGGFSFAVPGLSQTSQLRVATLDTPPVFSPVVLELVAVRVSLHVRGTGRRGFARLYGTVTPEQLGGLVRLQLLRPGRKAVTVVSTAISSAMGSVSRFSRVVHVDRGGLYRASAVVVGGAQVSGVSRAIRVG